MMTKKQEELIENYLSVVGENLSPLYRELFLYLFELGYHPQKQRSYIVFKHSLHNKMIAKTGIRVNKEKDPFFALRFSACRGYSKRFEDIIREAVDKDHYPEAKCMNGECNYCNGEPITRVYQYTMENGDVRYHCGASALEIPAIKKVDVEEIKKMIKQEHEFLMKQEAGV